MERRGQKRRGENRIREERTGLDTDVLFCTCIVLIYFFVFIIVT